MRTRLMVVAALVASLAGCSPGTAGKAAGNVAGNVAGKVAGKVGGELVSLPTVRGAVQIPKARIPPVPRAQVQTLAVAAQHEAIALIAPYVDDLPVPAAHAVVRGSCVANDLVEIGTAGSWDAAAAKALGLVGGPAALRYRVANLAEDMAQARLSGNRAVMAGVFLLCETV